VIGNGKLTHDGLEYGYMFVACAILCLIIDSCGQEHLEVIVEVNLCGLLELGRRDLNGDEYLGQLGFSRAYSFGDWFSFAKRRAPSLVCIDDNRYCMKHWKSGFFLINWRAIPDSMLRDMPEGVLVLSGLSHVWKSRICDPWIGVEVQEEPLHDIRPTLQRLLFYYTPPADVGVVIPDPTLEDLAVDNSDNESDDDDACVKILLVTPICFAAVIPTLGNQGGSSAAPATKGPSTRDSRGKGIMVDDVAASFVGMSRPRPSSGLASSFRDVSGDAIHKDFFPFSAGPYYAAYLEGGVAMVVDQFPIPGEMIRVETLSGDQLTAKMSMSHCMIMSHGGELLARYHGLPQSHHEYVLSADSRLKGYKERVAGKEEKRKIKSLTKSLDNLHVEVARLSADLNRATILEAKKDEEILFLKATPLGFASFFRVQFYGLVWKFLASDEFSRVQGELLSLAASVGFEHGLSMHQTKDEFAAMLKKMAHFNYEHATEPVSVILQLEHEKLARLANVPTLRDARVSPHIVKESTVSPAFESLELPTNVVPTSSTVASEQNEVWVNAMVDGPDLEITDGAANAKSGSVFVQGTSYAFDDTVGVTEEGSKRASFSPSEIVVAFSAGKKGDGSLPSSTADEEAAANPFMLLVFLSSLVVICFLHGVVVHWSCLLRRRGSLCLLLRPHAKVFVFELCLPIVRHAMDCEAWSDALKFKQMAYECIFSSGLTRIIPTPEPSLIASLPRYNFQALGVGVDFS
ncbi:hypothetical protein Tco_0957136, partial [Tanacetum coccineum]